MPLVFGPLIAVHLHGTRSDMLARSSGLLQVFVLRNSRGVFSKELDRNRLFGRALCDHVKDVFRCAGFFTSDEIPRYGLAENDMVRLFALYREGDRDRDTLVCTMYGKDLSERIRQTIVFLLDNDEYYAREYEDLLAGIDPVASAAAG